MSGSPKTLFRIIKHVTPTAADFLSGAKAGQKKPNDPVQERYWHGFSAFDTLDGARKQARRFRKLGNFIGEIAVVSVVGVKYEQSFGPGHYTVWAEPEQCARNVVRVYAVWDEMEE